MGRHERKTEQESGSTLFHVTVKVSINKNLETVRITTVDEHTISRETAIPKAAPGHRLSPTRKRTNTNTTRQLAGPVSRIALAGSLTNVNATPVRTIVKLLARQIASKLMEIAHRQYASLPLCGSIYSRCG